MFYLRILDLSHNKLEDESIIEIFEMMPELVRPINCDFDH